LEADNVISKNRLVNFALLLGAVAWMILPDPIIGFIDDIVIAVISIFYAVKKK